MSKNCKINDFFNEFSHVNCTTILSVAEWIGHHLTRHVRYLASAVLVGLERTLL